MVIIETKFEWEKEFLRTLADLPSQEQQKAIEFYNELFNDKYDCGMAERDIVISMGDPHSAAEQIRQEYFATGSGGTGFSQGVNAGANMGAATGANANADASANAGVFGDAANGGSNAKAGSNAGADGSNNSGAGNAGNEGGGAGGNSGGSASGTYSYGNYSYRPTYNPSNNAYTHSSDKTVNAILNVLLGIVYIFILIFLWSTLVGIIIGGAATAIAGAVVGVVSIIAVATGSGAGVFLAMLGAAFITISLGTMLIGLGIWLSKQCNLITKDLASRSKKHFEESAR